MTKLKNRTGVFRLLVLFLAAVVSLLLVEVIVRTFGIGPEVSPVWKGNYQLSANQTLRYELKPGSKDGNSSINQDGMRDVEYTVQKSSNRFRVAVIGDSIAYGLGVDQSRTFSSHLERLLNTYVSDAVGLTFEVLNFGVTGYSFTQIVENLRVRALKYDPDLILYAYCLNDPQEYSLEMAHLLAEMTEARRSYKRALGEGPSGILEQSRVFLLVRYLIRSRQQRTKHPIFHRDDPQFVALRKGSH